MGFESIIQRLGHRELILPYLETALLNDKWPMSYPVIIDSSPYYGTGDGYFHPSTHPLLSERVLYYMFHPEHRDKIIHERNTLQRQMTLAMGSALHGVLQTQMLMTGLVTDPADIELEYVNTEHHVRGRSDWIASHPSGERILVEMKALACDTPILTARGWTTMADVKQGDEVYGPDGLSTRVLASHPVLLNRPCYRVRFADGQSIVSDEHHLWTVRDSVLKRRTTMSTGGLLAAGLRFNVDRQFRFFVDVPDSIKLPDVHLPLDPWVLGMWLGDGSASSPTLTCGESDLEYLTSRLDQKGLSYSVGRQPQRAPTVYLRGIRGILGKRGLGLLDLEKTGDNGFKHIPEEYMLASEAQRRALLAGLMDSDGTLGDHQASISMKSEYLMSQVLQLVRSLGYRATWWENRAKLNGVDYGPVYWVKFSTKSGPSPFEMPRKVAKWMPSIPKQDLRKNAIVAIERVDSVPVRCITVDNESALYLAGCGFVPTHNTINSWGYNSLTEPKPEWKNQTNLGMDNLGFDYAIMVILESGFPYRMREMRVDKDQQLLDDIYGKFDRVREAIALNEPPRPCCPMGSPEMKECPARNVCPLGIQFLSA